jgi:hypothetical protein
MDIPPNRRIGNGFIAREKSRSMIGRDTGPGGSLRGTGPCRDQLVICSVSGCLPQEAALACRRCCGVAKWQLCRIE